jgi:hypothetical protein
MNDRYGAKRCVALALALLAAGTAGAQATDDTQLADRWQWRATLYGWFPSLDSTSNFALPNGDAIRVETNPDNYLRNLQFAFMGTLEARKGPWSILGDAVYVDFGKSNPNVTSIGPKPLPVPANAHADLKGLVGALVAGYTVAQSPAGRADVIGGVRYLHLKASADAEFTPPVPGLPPAVGVERSKDIWDGIVGVRGAAELENKWFVPYHFDVGTGDSRFTWQAFAGLGYHFSWGDAMVGYRHLAYDFKSDQPVSTMAFSGPIVGVGFRF